MTKHLKPEPGLGVRLRLREEGKDKYWEARIVCDERVIGRGEAKVTPTDPGDASAITSALHNFHQRVGLDIQYDNPADKPLGPKEDIVNEVLSLLGIRPKRGDDRVPASDRGNGSQSHESVAQRGPDRQD